MLVMAFTVLLSCTQYLVVCEWYGGKAKGGSTRKKKEASDVIMAAGAELKQFRLYVMLLCIIYTRELSIIKFSAECLQG